LSGENTVAKSQQKKANLQRRKDCPILAFPQDRRNNIGRDKAQRMLHYADVPAHAVIT